MPLPTTDQATTDSPAANVPPEAPKTPQEAADPRVLAEKWSLEITASEKELLPFHEESRKTLQRYLDRRQSIGGVVGDLGSDGVFRQNLFWSTVQVLLSNLYAKKPKVDVSRTDKDQNDDVYSLLNCGSQFRQGKH